MNPGGADPDRVCLVWVTAPDAEQGATLAREGSVQEDSEVLLIMKSRAQCQVVGEPS